MPLFCNCFGRGICSEPVKISIKEWTEKTNAIGIFAKTGRYGGTYAYKDIAFEIGMWISPEFKIYLIKEFELSDLKKRSKNN